MSAPPAGPTDRELLRRFAHAGDDDAFEALGRRYERLVYATCLRELGRADLAADAAQETFLLLARSARKVAASPATSLAGWLFVAARNVARNARRAEARRKAHEEEATVAWEQERERVEHDLWDRLEPRLNDAIGRLRPDDREALVLRYFEQRSLAEIGSALGVGENAAQMRVRRALERLRERLRTLGIVVPAALLATLLDERAGAASVPAEARLPERIAAAARHGREMPPLSHGPLVPRPMPAWKAGRTLSALVGLLSVAAVVAPRLAPRAEPSRLDIRRVATLGAYLGGDWAGTATDAMGKVTPLRLRIDRSPDRSRLTLRFDYPAPRGTEWSSWFVDRRTGRLVENGRDVYRLGSRGTTVSLEGWERRNSGTEVLWRRARQEWTRSGDTLSVRLDAGSPLRRQAVLDLRRRSRR